MSTLVYATPLHPARGHLPVNLHPPKTSPILAGGLAGACRRRPCSSRFNRQALITHGAALLGPQGHDHRLGCRHLHLLGDAPQRHRGHHLGASSSVWRSSRRGPACSSTSSSSDASFCTCLEHAKNVMYLCSCMRRAELLAQQPVLSGAVVFGACVCGRVTTRLVQTCVVTIREPVGSTRGPWSGNIKISAGGHVHTKQDDLWAKQLVLGTDG